MTPSSTGAACRRLAAAAGIAVLFCLPPARAGGTSPPTETPTRWTMINVSPGAEQADCHLIEFPDGRKALIDIADAADAPGAALAYLRSRGVTAIDLVLISHFHRDHYGRLADLVRAGMRIGRVAVNVPSVADEAAEREKPWGFDRKDVSRLLRLLHDQGIPTLTPKAGDCLLNVPLGGGGSASLDVVCLFNGADNPTHDGDVNDTSIIVRLSHGPTRVLFTGDLNADLGAWLARSDYDLRADVLKVPHHGTEGCAPNAFFDRVAATAALVPSPKGLWLSPRSQRIRDYFASHHIPTYVSGINGNVTVIMTADGFRVETERAP